MYNLIYDDAKIINLFQRPLGNFFFCLDKGTADGQKIYSDLDAHVYFQDLGYIALFYYYTLNRILVFKKEKKIITFYSVFAPRPSLQRPIRRARRAF